MLDRNCARRHSHCERQHCGAAPPADAHEHNEREPEAPEVDVLGENRPGERAVLDEREVLHREGYFGNMGAPKPLAPTCIARIA